ncbi:MAG: AraC family transcriptional regulator [Tannerellaceae bacterium]|jgi:AraC-like DNA-binding protein|nr:AraC family transcriptional regulator [Tannerellaceae bacterium]
MDNKIDVLKELTLLSAEDCFLITQRIKNSFTYPLHIHTEFELNYLENANGAIRIVEDSMEEISDLDLILVAGGTSHAYSNHKCKFEDTTEITIQFSRSMFDSLINKRHFKTIKTMFENAAHGLLFSRQTIIDVRPKLKMISGDVPDSFRNFLLLVEILKNLSIDGAARRLNSSDKIKNFSHLDSDRLEKIMLFMHENYHRQVTLTHVANLINTSDSSLTRFLKKWTGKTFIDNLNDIRISGAACRLVDTSDSIAEICYKCGYNNLSNFNRAFRKRKGLTPTEYREKCARSRFMV